MKKPYAFWRDKRKAYIHTTVCKIKWYHFKAGKALTNLIFT